MCLPRARAAAVSATFLIAILLGPLAGCSSYCVNIQSDPGATINTGTTCGNTTMTGNVVIAFGSSSASDSAASSANIPAHAPQIFVTLRGVDALPPSTPGNDAPAWQPLAPQLAARPVQLDLDAHIGDFCATTQLGTATVPAGVYPELRVRFARNLADRTSARPSFLLNTSPCGTGVLNCIVPNAIGRPFALDVPAEIEISSERIAGGSIAILPNTTSHLAISPAVGSSALALSASVERSCPPAE